jgi:uncharacterized protein (TIGR02145 family)
MMDRNLGATSVTPGNVTSLGLLYQWGRKDPFLNVGEKNNAAAKSTGKWPLAVIKKKDILDFSIKNPMTFIQGTSETSFDWISSNGVELWSDKKTIYDPCPVGWRVPDGGDNGVWNVAGFSSTTYDDTNKGISFSISSSSTTWYPASGYRGGSVGTLSNVGNYGSYWSVTPSSYSAYCLSFGANGNVYPTDSYYRASGFSVRCLRESE